MDDKQFFTILSSTIKCGYYELDISPLTRFNVKYSAAYVETTALFCFLLFGVRVFICMKWAKILWFQQLYYHFVYISFERYSFSREAEPRIAHRFRVNEI